MDHKTVQNWLVASKADVIAMNGLPADWWPTTSAKKGNQAIASAWAARFFLCAAEATAAGRSLTVHCSDGKNRLSKTVVDTHWVKPLGHRHDSTQMMLDFCVTNDSGSDPIQVTGESELFPSHPINPAIEPVNGYTWDFFKLLVVPSATRLFFARVAASGDSAPARVQSLADMIRDLLDKFGPAMLRPNDELAAVVIPATATDRDQTTIVCMSRGRVRIEKVAPRVI